MKPTRGHSNSWFGGLPKERRMALISIALLLALLGAIVLYQQSQAPAEPLQQLPESLEAYPQPAMVPQVSQTEVPAGASAGDLAQSAPGAAGAPSTPEAGAQAAPAAPPKVAPLSRLSYPLTGKPQMIKAYQSLDEAYGDFRIYSAMAYGAAPGQSVLAAARGKVLAIEHDPAEGRTLVIDHGGGMTTRYSGLGKVLVAQGAQVEAGAIVAEVGTPGAARAEMGTHLSFAVWLDNLPVDPIQYLKD